MKQLQWFYTLFKDSILKHLQWFYTLFNICAISSLYITYKMVLISFLDTKVCQGDIAAINNTWFIATAMALFPDTVPTQLLIDITKQPDTSYLRSSWGKLYTSFHLFIFIHKQYKYICIIIQTCVLSLKNNTTWGLRCFQHHNIETNLASVPICLWYWLSSTF